MIRLCERCYSPIERGEDHVRLAHIDGAQADGTLSWCYSYLHTAACCAVAGERSAAEPPDTGDWNPVRRAFSPAAARWAARSAPRSARAGRGR
ncbi:hypothetical protein [Pseudonocardia asaccharolytica]|uniref:Uncharacterized protein n=1 Tax=Pseudonocardia asaccharolytica DSM 44247 = NBRC 16224 TaxID=1123024 RepID=A0A511D5B0_9PSEU|nr:hypothetical protein [Pseudonocardia asaccharolytica]GEL19961.1 hypothetical protein PA7_37980 [Pseudonocardia asaccharolytica DSM 44247 = NBRC 16224]